MDKLSGTAAAAAEAVEGRRSLSCKSGSQGTVVSSSGRRREADRSLCSIIVRNREPRGGDRHAVASPDSRQDADLTVQSSERALLIVKPSQS